MRKPWLVLVLPFLVISLTGWIWNKKKADVPLVMGDWKSVRPELQGLQLSFDIDERFKADFPNGDTNDIMGDYDILADKIIFEDNSSVSDTLCKEKAYYYFKFVHGELWLTLIADGCQPRREILPGRWSKIENPPVKVNKKSKSKKSENEIMVQ